MIPQVAKAMSAGFTAKQVIDYLIKKFPNHADKIKNALAAGYTVDQVAKYLGGGKKALNHLENLQENSNEVNTEFSKTRKKDIEKENFNNKVVTGAGLAGVSALTAPMAATAMSRALPQNLLRLGQRTQILPQSNPVPSQSPMSPGPNSPGTQVMGGKAPINPIQGAQPQPSPNNITQPPIQSQAPIAQRDPQKNIELIKSIGIEPNLKNMIKGGMSIEDMAAVAPKIFGKEVAKKLASAEGGIQGALEDYANTMQEQPHEQVPIESGMQELDGIQPESERNLTNDLLPETTEPVEKQEPIQNWLIEQHENELSRLRRNLAENEYSKQKKNELKKRFRESEEFLKKNSPNSKALKEELNKYTIDEDYHRKYLKANPGEYVGDLGDFFEGTELRKKFKDVLNTPVFRGTREHQEKKLAGLYNQAGKIYLVNSSRSLFDTLTHEATHALQEEKGKEFSFEEQYENQPHEISANKLMNFFSEKHKEENAILNQKKIDKLLSEKIKEKEKDKSIEKHSTVLSPQGIGEVKEIRNGKALVEVDGKIHKVDEEDIIQSPVTEKELDELYDDLIKGIEKSTGKQVSRNVDWAGYDPKTNELAYKPHGSDRLYAYGDISPEDVELLTSLLTRRKTTGENLIGAWEKDTESPIGAAMYQLIKKLQFERGGKGNEYKNRYDTIYDALEPAKIAKKKKYEEQRKKAKKSRSS